MNSLRAFSLCSSQGSSQATNQTKTNDRTSASTYKPSVTVLKSEGPVTEKRSRFWNFLTLGIPAFIKYLSSLWAQLKFRAKTGAGFNCRFTYDTLKEKSLSLVGEFHRYNEFSYSILNNSELNKCTQVLNTLINERHLANKVNDEETAQSCWEKIQNIAALLEKNKVAKLSRASLSPEDWKTLDLIDFEVAKDYFHNLSEVFNSNWFKGLRFNNDMMSHFNVDYHESIIAESLALSFAYIEGLEGKTITLPIFNKESGKFQPVLYTIKESRMGDMLPYYILESEDKDAPPWLVVRGTASITAQLPNGQELRTGSFESWQADAIDHEGIATHIINKSMVHQPIIKVGKRYVQKESLAEIFGRWKNLKKPAILAGHSLGGTLVNSLSVEFYDSIQKVYSFSGAGVSKETISKWNEIPTNSRPKIINFDFEGDIIPSGGYGLIGKHLAIQSLLGAQHPRGAFVTHVRSHLNQDFRIQLVDLEKENRKFGRYLSEKFRVFVGYLLSLYRKPLPDWWKNRKIYSMQADILRNMRC